jgi:ribosomal protein S1
LLANPWDSVEERYKVNQLVEGTITRIVDYGGFAEIEPGVEGLLHVSQLSRGNVENVQEVIQEGETHLLRIVSIDPDRQRIGLSLKAVTASEQIEWMAQREAEAVEAEAAAVPDETAETAEAAEEVTAVVAETTEIETEAEVASDETAETVEETEELTAAVAETVETETEAVATEEMQEETSEVEETAVAEAEAAAEDVVEQETIVDEADGEQELAPAEEMGKESNICASTGVANPGAQ